MGALIDFLIDLLMLPHIAGTGWFARIVSYCRSASALVLVMVVVSLPPLAIGSMVWERWGEMSFGLRLVAGSLGLLFVIIAVGSIGLFVKRLVCPAPRKGSEGSEADRAAWRR